MGRFTFDKNYLTMIYINKSNKIVKINSYNSYSNLSNLYADSDRSCLRINNKNLYFNLVCEENKIKEVNITCTKVTITYLGPGGQRSDWDRKPEFSTESEEKNINFNIENIYNTPHDLYDLINSKVTLYEFIKKSVLFIINKANFKSGFIEKIEIDKWDDNVYKLSYLCHAGQTSSFLAKLKSKYKEEIISGNYDFDFGIRTEILGELWTLYFVSYEGHNKIYIYIPEITSRFNNNLSFNSALYWLLEKTERFDQHAIYELFTGKLKDDHHSKIEKWFEDNAIRNKGYEDPKSFKSVRKNDILLQYGKHESLSILRVFRIEDIFSFMKLYTEEQEKTEYSSQHKDYDYNDDWSDEDMWNHIQNE